MSQKFESKEGQRVPEVTFRCREGGDWKDVSSAELFGGKRVVVFSLPGAFTPTCSSAHLPRYEELAERFAGSGVDEIVCLSVNDGFVMEAWGKDQGATRVRLIPDGNGEFTRGMGMLVDKAELGFGPRSWRYSMLVEDGVVTKMFIEPDEPGDPFKVSDADTMLAHIDPSSAQAKHFTLFTKAGCPHCARAKARLKEAGHRYEEIAVGAGGLSQGGLKTVTGRTTVPQVYVEGQHIGGADDLEAWLDKGAAATA